MYTLAPLPYAYEALEPHIDATTMQLHHDKHHQAYLDKLNAAVENHPELAALPIEALLKQLPAQVQTLPADIYAALRNHGGGYANHNLFWEILTPGGAKEPNGELAAAIATAFGDMAGLKTKLVDAATKQFGSGWAWLVVDEMGKLAVYSTPNQDSPLMQQHQPLLGIDVWEHAYYLKYQNRRPEYLEAVWQLLNWDVIAARYLTTR